MIQIAVLVVLMLIAIWLMRHPYLRSARLLVILALSGGTALLLTILSPQLGSILAVPALLVPLVASLLFGRHVSALPPADFDESEMIDAIRRSLHQSGSKVEDAASEARDMLRSHPLPAPEWAPVRHALLEQIDLVEGHRLGQHRVSQSEASRSSHKTIAAWRSAIEARRRFLR